MEFIMSALNGDKSRFNRLRKQKIARRKRTRELLKNGRSQAESVDTSSRAKQQSVPA
jgi:hypothetical protein